MGIDFEEAERLDGESDSYVPVIHVLELFFVLKCMFSKKSVIP